MPPRSVVLAFALLASVKECPKDTVVVQLTGVADCTVKKVDRLEVAGGNGIVWWIANQCVDTKKVEIKDFKLIEGAKCPQYVCKDIQVPVPVELKHLDITAVTCKAEKLPDTKKTNRCGYKYSIYIGDHLALDPEIVIIDDGRIEATPSPGAPPSAPTSKP